MSGIHTRRITKTGICQWCHKPWEKYLHAGGKERKFCSEQCRWDNYHHNRKARAQ